MVKTNTILMVSLTCLFVFFTIINIDFHKISIHLKNETPTQFDEFLDGVAVRIKSTDKIVALTLDACAKDYDEEMMNVLQKNNIPATLFVSGLWIKANKKIMSQLAKNTNFHIENHGLHHKPLAVNSQKIYGIKAHANIQEAINDIVINANEIERYTGRRPIFFRSGTAYYDDVGIEIAHKLDHSVIGFDVLSGDAIPHKPAEEIVDNVMSQVKPGSIIIMHMNHPEWNGAEALETIIKRLTQDNYQFVFLRDYKNQLEYFKKP